LRMRVEQFSKSCSNPLTTTAALQVALKQMTAERQQAVAMAMASPAFGPVTAAACRELYERRGLNIRALVQGEGQVYWAWQRRIDDVMAQLEQERNRQEAGKYQIVRCEGVRC